MYARSIFYPKVPVSRCGRKQSNGISGELGMAGSTGMQDPEEVSNKIEGIRQYHVSSFHMF
jgi:hypothetical protein